MRVLDRIADLAEEAEAVLDGKPVLVAPFGDRDARDVFQNDVWRSLLGGAAIEQTGDIRMLQFRQDLPLAAESRRFGPSNSNLRVLIATSLRNSSSSRTAR